MKVKIIYASVFFFSIVGIGIAFFTMAYVPQTVGFKDVSFGKLKEADCRECHGSNLSDRHHVMVKSNNMSCTDCHFEESGKMVVPNDCTECHSESPHHQTAAAKSFKCAECHDPNLVTSKTGDNLYTLESSNVVVRRESCQNCHKAATMQDGLKVDGNKDLHHTIKLGTGGCVSCHNIDNKADFRCRNCHGRNVIHNVKAHVDAAEKCTSCHAEPNENYPLPTAIPVLNAEPNNVVPQEGTFTARGKNFGTGLNTSKSFITLANASGKESFRTVNWSDTEATFYVNRSIDAGNYTLSLTNEMGESNKINLTVMDRLSIDTIQPLDTFGGDVMTITGDSFLTKDASSKVLIKSGGLNLEAEILAWTNNEIKVKIPKLPTGTARLVVKNFHSISNGRSFNVVSQTGPSLRSVVGGKSVGATLTLYGLNFGTERAGSRVLFGTTEATYLDNLWYNTRVTVQVPNLTKGKYQLKIIVGGKESNTLDFEIP